MSGVRWNAASVVSPVEVAAAQSGNGSDENRVGRRRASGPITVSGPQRRDLDGENHGAEEALRHTSNRSSENIS